MTDETDELTLDDLPQPAFEGAVDINSLNADGDNPNRMKPDVFETLQDRMLDRGWIGGPILTDTDGTIADGEHRWRAAREIGLVEVPVKQYDVDDAGRRLIRQEANKIRGEHNSSKDAKEYDKIIQGGYTVPLEELTEARNEDLEELLNSLDDTDDELPDVGEKANDPYEEWQEAGLAEYKNEDQTSNYDIKVHFRTKEDLMEFADLVDQKITEKTDSIWYPEREWADVADQRYVAEPDASDD